MENYEPKTSGRRCPRAPHHVAARAHSWPRHHMVWAPRSPSPTLFHPVPSFCYETFCYIIPRTPRGTYIIFSSCFCFDMFPSGIVLSFRSTMTSAKNDKEKSLGRMISKILSWRRRSRVKLKEKWKKPRVRTLAPPSQALEWCQTQIGRASCRERV